MYVVSLHTVYRLCDYASRYNIILSRRTLSASRYCPGGHNLLADSVRGHNQHKNNCSISSKCCIIIYNKMNVAQIITMLNSSIIIRTSYSCASLNFSFAISPTGLQYVNSTLQDAAFYTAVLFKTCQGHGLCAGRLYGQNQNHGLRGTVVRSAGQNPRSRTVSASPGGRNSLAYCVRPDTIS